MLYIDMHYMYVCLCLLSILTCRQRKLMLLSPLISLQHSAEAEEESPLILFDTQKVSRNS